MKDFALDYQHEYDLERGLQHRIAEGKFLTGARHYYCWS